MSRLLPLYLVCFILPAARAGEIDSSSVSKQIIEFTNRERKRKDLPPLTPSSSLFKVAQAHSKNMAKQEKMEHNLDGKTPLQRVRAAGYAYARIHENIAAGDPQVPLADLMKAWMNSKGHRDNILNDQCTQIGVGVARGKNGQVYYTQLFGRPK